MLNVDLNPCRKNSLCKNGGTCIYIGGSTYRCKCVNGYTGTNCSQGQYYVLKW